MASSNSTGPPDLPPPARERNGPSALMRPSQAVRAVACVVFGDADLSGGPLVAAAFNIGQVDARVPVLAEAERVEATGPRRSPGEDQPPPSGTPGLACGTTAAATATTALANVPGAAAISTAHQGARQRSRTAGGRASTPAPRNGSRDTQQQHTSGAGRCLAHRRGRRGGMRHARRARPCGGARCEGDPLVFPLLTGVALSRSVRWPGALTTSLT